MKKLGCLFFLCFVLNNCFSQYMVTKVIGNVKKISGETVKIGSVLNENEALLFSSQNDMVRAIIAGKGTYVIVPNKDAKQKDNQLLEILKYTMHVKSKEGYLSGRSSSSDMVPGIFETDAKINTKNLIGNTSKFLFSIKEYNVSDGCKFFLQIGYDGMKPVIHPLKTNADTLLISSDDFKTDIADTGQNVKYTIGFFSKQKGTSESIADIDPYFDKSGEMEAIIKAVISQSKETDKNALQQQCYEEVCGALGRPSDIDFKNAFERMIKSRKKK